MIDIDALVRPNIQALRPYSSARDEFQGINAVFLDANENPYGQYNRYPDPYQIELKTKIGGFKGVDSSRIFLGNGSDEIIDLLIRIFCEPGQDSIATLHPTYGMYEVSAAINNIEILTFELDGNFQLTSAVIDQITKSRAKLLFICSPNNPTGNCIDKESIETLLEKFNGLVVLDEAYIDFCIKRSFLNSIQEYDNLIITQTFSKAWASAGIRLGMAFCSVKIIGYLNKVKPPYNISALNQEKALSILENKSLFDQNLNLILEEKEQLRVHLLTCEVVEKVYPSDANFYLVKLKTDAHRIYNQLIRNNVVVRNRSMLIENCIRVTVGTKEENELFINELKMCQNGE